MACAVGDTLIEGTRMLQSLRRPGQYFGRAAQGFPYALLDERTFEQDPKYPIRLLVDIAIKALSPAINDLTTAVQAIDSDRGPVAAPCEVRPGNLRGGRPGRHGAGDLIRCPVGTII